MDHFNDDTQWLKDLWKDSPEEIGADEDAVRTAGLKTPKDAKVDAILEEFHAMEDGGTRRFTGQEQSELERRSREHRKMREQQAQQEAEKAARLARQEAEKAERAARREAEKAARRPIRRVPDPVPDAGEEQPKRRPAKSSAPKKPREPKGLARLGLPQALITLIWLLTIVAVGVVMGKVAWACCADLMAFGKEDKQASIVYEEGDDLGDVAEKLHDEGLVRYPGLFKLFATLTHKASRMEPGTYFLNSKYDYNAICNAMIPGKVRQEVEVMIPEGYTCAQIFSLLQEKGVCTVTQMEEYAADGELGDYWFLEGVTRGDRYCLEGYLFPDTYRFYQNDQPVNVLTKLLDNFDDRFTDLMKEKLETMNETFGNMLRRHGLSEDYISQHQITIREIVIIASMVEKETASTDESYTIASVIYNRLSNPGSYPFLNIDAALVYALGGKKEKLTDADMATDTPYNTYLYQGLIPGPISNPGRDSLNAALDPDTTTYYFYAYDPSTKRHRFNQTYGQHEAFLKSIG